MSNEISNADGVAVVPTPQQISDYLNGLDAIQREVVEREARARGVPPSASLKENDRG